MTGSWPGWRKFLRGTWTIVRTGGGVRSVVADLVAGFRWWLSVPFGHHRHDPIECGCELAEADEPVVGWSGMSSGEGAPPPVYTFGDQGPTLIGPTDAAGRPRTVVRGEHGPELDVPPVRMTYIRGPVRGRDHDPN